MLYLYLIAPDIADVKSKRIKSIAINDVKLSSAAQISFEGSSYYYLVTIKQLLTSKRSKI
ncbi:hypothetical protein [Streptococcus equi]|uniref:hypothetical protein n=1 Tax=Streptococcus equi TaxID=1336 RepID=UPI00202F1685|nr:hypothetical protein [Streptococcus equi]